MAFEAKDWHCDSKVALQVGLLQGKGDSLTDAWQALWAQDRDADAQAIGELLATSQRSALQAALLIYLSRRHFEGEAHPAQAWLAWAMQATGLARRTVFAYAAAAACLAVHSVHHVTLFRLDILSLSVLNRLTAPQMALFMAAHPRPEDLSRDELTDAVARIKGLPAKAAKAAVQLELDWEAWMPEKRPVGTAAKEWHGAQVMALRAITAVEAAPDEAVLADMEQDFAAALAQVRALRAGVVSLVLAPAIGNRQSEIGNSTQVEG